MKAIELSGMRFGRWTVVSRGSNNPEGRTRWLCRCECGIERVVTGFLLRGGQSQSCGCLAIENTIARGTIHGHGSTQRVSPTYRAWCNMIGRCTNPKDQNYANYGGRGITVCERWRDFRNFLSDMRERPEGLTLERVDNDGNYEPSNCKWATMTEQGRNRRKNHLITIGGSTKTIAEWAEEFGMDHRLLRNRLARGMPIERALTARLFRQTSK